jgi:hypothetical protein
VILYTASRHASETFFPLASVIAGVLERHIHSAIWPKVVVGNYKSVHIVQACMLWATFLPEPRPGEDDLGWTLFGHASELVACEGTGREH